MRTVQPIRDAQIISQIKKLLLDRGSKYYIMFVIGLNTGLRVSDILKLRVTYKSTFFENVLSRETF